MILKNDIYVDLDGTLITNDCFVEQIKLFVFDKPLNIFKLIYYFTFFNKSKVKKILYYQVGFDINLVVLNLKVIQLLKQFKDQGHKLHLYSGSYYKIVEQVFNHIDLFQSFEGSSDNKNLTGKFKLNKILSKNNKFIYFGNSFADIPIWKKAKMGYVVSNSLIAKFKIYKLFRIEVI